MHDVRIVFSGEDKTCATHDGRELIDLSKRRSNIFDDVYGSL